MPGWTAPWAGGRSPFSVFDDGRILTSDGASFIMVNPESGELTNLGIPIENYLLVSDDRLVVERANDDEWELWNIANNPPTIVHTFNSPQGHGASDDVAFGEDFAAFLSDRSTGSEVVFAEGSSGSTPRTLPDTAGATGVRSLRIDGAEFIVVNPSFHGSTVSGFKENGDVAFRNSMDRMSMLDDFRLVTQGVRTPLLIGLQTNYVPPVLTAWTVNGRVAWESPAPISAERVYSFEISEFADLTMLTVMFENGRTDETLRLNASNGNSIRTPDLSATGNPYIQPEPVSAIEHGPFAHWWACLQSGHEGPNPGTVVLYGLDGTELWRRPVDQCPIARGMLDGVVLESSDNRVEARSLETGDIVWAHTEPNAERLNVLRAAGDVVLFAWLPFGNDFPSSSTSGSAPPDLGVMKAIQIGR